MAKAMNGVEVFLSSEDRNYTFVSLTAQERQFPASVQPMASDGQLASSFADLLSFETVPDQPTNDDIFNR